MNETEIVLACVQENCGVSGEDRLLALLRAGAVDWSTLWSVGAVQEVQPLIARALSSPAVAGHVPENVLAEARSVRLQTAAYGIAIHAELLRLGGLLRDAQVTVVPLKGTHLAQRLYGTLVARRVGDIDILVEAHQLGPARDVLRQAGYSPMEDVTHGIEAHGFHGVPWVRRSGGPAFVVELHWGLSDARFVAVDYVQLWQRVRAYSGSASAGGHADGEQALSPLPPEETLLFLALHLPKHDSGTLRLLADIDRLLRREGERMDWLYVLATAEQWDLPWLLYFALERAQILFDSPVARWVLQRLKPAAWRCASVGLLAGPRVLLDPPLASHLRGHRFRLAYCAMLNPARRALGAYVHYLFTPYAFRRPGSIWKGLSLVEGVCRGVAWTGLVVIDCATERWRVRGQLRAGLA